MAYTKTEWKDHVSDNKYKITQNSDGTSSITQAGKVAQQGTPMSAVNFNHMEAGIYDADQTAAEALEKAENHTHNYAGSSSPGGVALKSNRITSIVKQSDTLTYNKYAKLATIELSQIYIGKTIKLFIVDALSGSTTAELYIHARAGATSGSYATPPTVKINSIKGDKSNYFLMYNGWTIELWYLSTHTDYINLEIFELANDDTASVSITYEKPLSWQTDEPTTGTKIVAIDAFSNYLPKSGGTVSGNLIINGSFKSSTSGQLLYSGTINTSSGSLTIPGLTNYSAILIQTLGAGDSGLNCGVTAVVPIAYISKVNSVQLYGGIIGSAYVTSNGPQAAKNMDGYITVSMTDGSSSTLSLMQSVGTIGTVQIYSII